MENKLTKKQKEFADEYLKTGNGTQSALKVYDTTNYNTGAVIANENINKPNIIKYFQDNAQKAAETIMDMINDIETSKPVKLNACKDVLDRAGYKPSDKLEHSGKIETGVVYLPVRNPECEK